MSERIFITGITGFIGSALANYARRLGAACSGVSRGGIGHPDMSRLDLVRDPDALRALILVQRPNTIYHLAGSLSGGEDPFVTYLVGTQNLLKAIANVPEYHPRLLVAGSAAEYGDVGTSLIAEDVRERPASTYGVAKLAQTRLVMSARRRGLDATVVRLFNVMGPGMSAHLAPARFLRVLLRAKAERSSRVTVGDLTGIRDYLDIEEVARGFWLIAQAPSTHEIVNLCSGTPVEMSEVFAEFARQIGVRVEPQEDAALCRGPEHVAVSVGNPRLMRLLTGTSIGFSLSDSVKRLLSSLNVAST